MVTESNTPDTFDASSRQMSAGTCLEVRAPPFGGVGPDELLGQTAQPHQRRAADELEDVVDLHGRLRQASAPR